jgi:stage II sporulation protein D
MQPNIEVGVLFSNAFSFTLKGIYLPGESDHQLEGAGTACLEGSLFRLYIGSRAFSLALPVTLEPQDYSSSCFELNDVTIGKGFHWERKENQKFKGALKIIREKDQLIAINTLPLEDYLISVISSEMSATASLHLLRAHAVISRSWLLAQKSKEQKLKKKGEYVTLIEREGERIKWYDREDHHHFDVCADDHCQRYQGITKASTANAEAAVADTCGEVLVYNNEICDARYSKACGGITERFENVWEPVEHAYLTRVIDNDTEPTGYNLDLTDESAAAKWIPGNPPAFCNTSDKNILSQYIFI